MYRNDMAKSLVYLSQEYAFITQDSVDIPVNTHI